MNISSLKIIGLILLGFIVLGFILIIRSHNSDTYLGSVNLLTSDWCDYGFNIKNKECCDEDDYSCEICIWEDYNCNHFPNQESAQRVYNECKYFFYNNQDYYKLDRDNDGVACELLPKK